MNDRPPAYPSRAALAGELCISESTVDEMVKRGVLPPPIRLSAGCLRWCWTDVEIALASLKNAQKAPESQPGDPYIRGARNVAKVSEGRRGTS